MQCSKCGSTNVTIVSEQTEGKMKTKHTGILWKLGRLCMIICTCGLWLIIGKKKETGRMKYKSKTYAICQGCGEKWEV